MNNEQHAMPATTQAQQEVRFVDRFFRLYLELQMRKAVIKLSMFYILYYTKTFTL